MVPRYALWVFQADWLSVPTRCSKELTGPGEARLHWECSIKWS
jgi:hypothetical protein